MYRLDVHRGFARVAVWQAGRVRQAGQIKMQTSLTPRFLSSVNTPSQNFAPAPPSPAQSPEDVALVVHGHADHHIHRLVGDLPVTDLDDHRAG
jgi:L-ascorbate metabolism protein UlaG (beta-lactamase superfamily)